MSEISGKVGAIYMSSGAGTNVSDETVTLAITTGIADDVVLHPNIIVNALYTDDGEGNADALIGEELYTWTVKGLITCVSEAENVVHVDYTYYTVEQVAGFFNWSLDIVGDALETTDFGDAGHRAYIAGMDGWSGSADRHYLTDVDMSAYIGSKSIVRFYMKTTTTTIRYEGWAHVTGMHLSTPVDGVVTEPLDFQGNYKINYETG